MEWRACQTPFARMQEYRHSAEENASKAIWESETGASIKWIVMNLQVFHSEMREQMGLRSGRGLLTLLFFKKCKLNKIRYHLKHVVNFLSHRRTREVVQLD